ncbi:MAG: hypothetical protein WD356_00560 [Pseudomonadales bacterium]
MNSNVDKVVDDAEIPIRLCNYVDVYKNDFIDTDLKFSAGSATKGETERFGLRVGDVIITKDSEDRLDIGVPAYVRATADDLVCGYHLAILRAKPDVMRGDFLFWSLQSIPAKDEFSNAAYGITRYGLTLGGIKSLPLPCPDLPTQKAIAHFLNCETARIDQLIEKKQQLVQLLQAKLENDTLRLLTRGADNHARMVDEPALEWIAERPEHWRIHRLKHFFRENTRYSVSGEEVLYSLRMNEGLVPHNDVSEKVIPPSDLVGYKKVSPGQIVMNRMRAAIGLFGLADAEGIVSPDYSIFDVRKTAHPAYFLRLFKTSPMMTAFRILSKGMGTGQSGFMRLNADRFGEVRVAIPDYDEQRKISDAVGRRIKQVALIQNTTEHSVELLREFRSALITAAVTGQIDVETWGKHAETDRRLDKIEEKMAAPRAAGQVEARA